jgi:hypothetical protein
VNSQNQHELQEFRPTSKKGTTYYPWGTMSDFVHDPDPSGRKFIAGVSGAEAKFGRFERWAIGGLILVMFLFLTIAAVMVS